MIYVHRAIGSIRSWSRQPATKDTVLAAALFQIVALVWIIVAVVLWR